MVSKKKVNVSLTLDPELVEQLKKLSFAEHRSLSQYVNIVLQDHIRQVLQTQQQSKA